MLVPALHTRPSLITVTQPSPELVSEVLAVSVDGVSSASYDAPLGWQKASRVKNAASKNLAGTFSFEQLNEKFTHARQAGDIFHSLCALVAFHQSLPDCILRLQFFQGRLKISGDHG